MANKTDYLFEGLNVLDEWENPRKARRNVVLIQHVNGKIIMNDKAAKALAEAEVTEVEPEKVGFTGKPAKPVAAKVREARMEAAGVPTIEHLTCQNCGSDFTRVVVRGRKPTKCEACR